MNLEKVNYAGWSNCYRLANGAIELVATTDVGPRLIHFGFAGQTNELKVFQQHAGQMGGSEWHIYGGHRLWYAPEHKLRSYTPDNAPVRLEEHTGFVRLVQTIEANTGIQKEIDIYLEEGAQVRLTHRLRNHNLWPVELAPWALTVMDVGGTAILPLPPYQSPAENLLPVGRLVLWGYSKLSDPRWTWGERFVFLRQDVNRRQPQKAGLMTPEGWIAYARQGHLFVKKVTFFPQAVYPDMGSLLETYTDHEFLELETLGPLASLAPGAAVEHVEDWYLFAGVPAPQSEEDVLRLVLPRVNELG